mgnify:CR=1 FL=1
MKKCCQMLAKYFGVMAVVFLVLGLVTPTSWLPRLRDGYWFRVTTLIPEGYGLSQALYNVQTYAFPVTWK